MKFFIYLWNCLWPCCSVSSRGLIFSSIFEIASGAVQCWFYRACFIFFCVVMVDFSATLFTHCLSVHHTWWPYDDLAHCFHHDTSPTRGRPRGGVCCPRGHVTRCGWCHVTHCGWCRSLRWGQGWLPWRRPVTWVCRWHRPRRNSCLSSYSAVAWSMCLSEGCSTPRSRG